MSLSYTTTKTPHPQLATNWQFPTYPNYHISRPTSTPILLDRQCQILLPSPFLSPVITPGKANPCRCLYLKRMCRERSSMLWGLHHHSLTTLSAPLSFTCYFPAHPIPHFCHDLFPRVPCPLRYGWNLLLCFLYFTIASDNLILPTNSIGL